MSEEMKLLPCPMCQSAAEYSDRGTATLHMIYCTGCDLKTADKKTRTDAIAVWNRRAPVRRCVEMERESGEAKRQYAWHLETRDQAIREYAMQVANLKAALRQAIDLISIPASRHHDGRDHITGSPRYSAGLLKHHAECAALLPVLKAALGERP